MELNHPLGDVWTAIWPWLSLAANGILAALLFFKSALNDVLTKYLARRMERRDRGRQMLLDLNKHMMTFTANHFLSVVGACLTLNPATSTKGKKMQDAGLAGLNSAITFIHEHELELPPSIRALTERLRRDMTLPAAGLANVDIAMSSNEKAGKAVNEVQAEIRSQLDIS